MSKKIWVQVKFLGPKIFWVKNNFGSKTILCQKNFRVKNNFQFKKKFQFKKLKKKNWGSIKFWGQKKFSVKETYRVNPGWIFDPPPGNSRVKIMLGCC